MLIGGYPTAIYADVSCFDQVALATQYARYSQAPMGPMSRRLEWLSRQFLNTPYVLFALGEGERGFLDQCPLYRFDRVDCETFVTTVLALALSHDLPTYQCYFKHLRYQKGKVSFLTRHHFTSIDWSQGALQRKLFHDFTPTFRDRTGRSVFKVSETVINKAGWVTHFSLDRVRLRHASKALKRRHLIQLQQESQHLPTVLSKLTYVPLNALFDERGRPVLFLFNQIPDAAIIEIVRPNWDLKNKIGTNLDISHLGFVFRHHGQLWLRHASPLAHRVVDQPLIAVLAQAKRVPSIGGIHVLGLVDSPRLIEFCKV